MAVVVVVFLEVVDIHHQQRHRLPMAHAAPPFAIQPLVKTTSVGNTGQAIAHRHLPQLLGALQHFFFQIVVEVRVHQRNCHLRAEQLKRLFLAHGKGVFQQIVFQIHQRHQLALAENRQTQH